MNTIPTAEELPDSDDTPVDDELQNLIPNLLRTALTLNWSDRMDWFLGVRMGIYYEPQAGAIVPDGFLSLGVERFKEGKLRPSYVLWQESNIVPTWVLEVVSKAPGGEYGEKMTKYAQLGVLYYTIYNPDYWQRDKHEPFEVHRLVDENYVRQSGEPFWIPEVGLGIGRGIGTHQRWTREWLYWYDQNHNRLSTAEDMIEQERQRAEQLERKIELLHTKLREQGIDPSTL